MLEAIMYIGIAVVAVFLFFFIWAMVDKDGLDQLNKDLDASNKAKAEKKAAERARKTPTFVRLNKIGISKSLKGPTTEISCGACGHAWVTPTRLARQYSSTMVAGAGLRGLNNTDEQINQVQVQTALRCPECGSIDPGVWVLI